TFTLLPPTDEAAPPLSVTASAHSPDDDIGDTMPIAVTFGTNTGVKVAIPDLRCGSKRCRTNQQCCANDCIDPLQEPTDCGGCGITCQDGESCAGGQCSCAGGSSCKSGLTCCAANGGCVDTAMNKHNCGGCGTQCRPGETCSGSACHCGTGAPCAANQFCC